MRGSRLLIALAVLLTEPLAAQPDRASPGEEVAAASALLKSDATETQIRGCKELVAQVRQGSKDPWAYDGAAACATQLEATRAMVSSAFAPWE